MASNSKNESLISSEKLSATDETVPLDASGEEVGLFEGQGMKIAILPAGDLA